MAITQRVHLNEWHNVYNRRKRLVGEWMVFKPFKVVEGYTYKAYTYDKTGEIEWDLSGENPTYYTIIEAAQAAIENILHP